MSVVSSRIILALDVDTRSRAAVFVRRLSGQVRIFKVGSQLFTGCGPGIVRLIRQRGREVFLDLKFHDIPHTVAQAVRQAVRLQVMMLTLHTSGGSEMMMQASAAARDEAKRLGSRRPLLLGVTVLTSQKTSAGKVLSLAKSALAAGLDGVVASAKEVPLLRRHLGKRCVIVTPGIRPACAAADDQKRVATPREALAAGSDYLVIGRPLLEAKNPARFCRDLLR